MDSSSGVYTSYVNLSESPQLISKSDLDQRSLSSLEDALRTGGSKLKTAIRTLHLHPGDPARKQLWPRMIAVQYGQPLTSLLISGTVDPGTRSFRLQMSDENLTPTYYLNDAGKLAVKRVLHVLGQQNPTLVYAPHVFPLASLMLHYMSERETLACLEVLLSQKNVIIQVSDTWRKHSHAISRLSTRYATKAHKFSTQNVESNPKSELTHWSHLIWTLPFEYVLRIVDCFFIEGIKILYRAGIILWKETYRLHLMSAKQPVSNLQHHFLQFNHYLVSNKDYSPQFYIQKMFKIRNFKSKVIHSMLESLDFRECDNCKSCVKPKPFGQSAGYIAFTLHDENPSSIVSKDDLVAILEQLDDHRLSQLMKPYLVFTTAKHGTSLKTFLQYSSEIEESILLIRTTDDEIFGAFLADKWYIPSHQRYYGRGATFIFTLKPNAVYYRWVNVTKDPLCNMFQKIGHDHLQIGGGQHGAAISIDANLDKGTSCASSTFGSPPLTSCEHFRVGVLELLGFKDIPV